MQPNSLCISAFLHDPSTLTVNAVLQDDVARRARLKTAAASLQLTDEQKGRGQQNNTLLELQRAAKAERRPSSAGGGEKPKQKEKAAEPAAGPGPEEVSLMQQSCWRALDAQ